MLKRLVITISYFALVIFICFGLLEVVLRTNRFLSPAFDQPGARFGLKILLDRKVLFRIKPKSRMDINNHGYRDRDFNVRKIVPYRILFLGDSFVIGLNVKSRETIPKVLEEIGAGRFEVFNMGVHGYGPDQSLLQLLNEGLKFNPDMIILSVYPTNDFNDIMKNNLFSLDMGGNLMHNSSNAVSGELPALDVFYLAEYLLWKNGLMDVDYEDLFITLFDDYDDLSIKKDTDSETSIRQLALMTAILKRFKDESSKRNIRFVVLIMPAHYIQNDDFLKKNGIPSRRYFASEDAVKAICEAESIPYINLYPRFLDARNGPALFDSSDGHLSMYGNEFTAKLIFKYLDSKGFPGR